jgi:hypothetical protein
MADRPGPALLTLAAARTGQARQPQGHCCVASSLRSGVAGLDAPRSDYQCEVVEDRWEPAVVMGLSGDVVVAALHILHEGMTGGDDPR